MSVRCIPDIPRATEKDLQLANATSSFSFNSPELYISIRMSEPPMNSPCTYTCGMVG